MKKTAAELKNEIMKKEAALNLALKSKEGMKKLAAALANPVRKHLDYRGIGRKFVVTEPYLDPGPMFYDADVEEFDAVLVGEDGTSRFVVAKATRVQIPEFEMVVRVKIPFKEVRTRKFKVVDRAKERLKQAFAIREDLRIFSIMHDTAVQSNQSLNLTGPLDKESLSFAFWQVDKRRLIPENIVLSPDAVFNMRNWEHEIIEETARIEIRRTGYLGTLWNANFYVSQLIKPIGSESFAYVTASPELTGWYPIRADVEVIPSDNPDLLLLGFTGYLQAGLIFHNPWAVARIGFVPHATPQP